MQWQQRCMITVLNQSTVCDCCELVGVSARGDIAMNAAAKSKCNIQFVPRSRVRAVRLAFLAGLQRHSKALALPEQSNKHCIPLELDCTFVFIITDFTLHPTIPHPFG